MVTFDLTLPIYALIVGTFILNILFQGQPDLMDAIIHVLMSY